MSKKRIVQRLIELLFTENKRKLDRECTNLKEKNGHQGMVGSVAHVEADENGNHGGNPSNNSSYYLLLQS
jgi:hypothetical protein